MLDVTLRRKFPAYTQDATGTQRFIDGVQALGERLGGQAHGLYLRGPREARVLSMQPLNAEMLVMECLDDDGGTFLVLSAVGVVQFEVRPAATLPEAVLPEPVAVGQ